MSHTHRQYSEDGSLSMLAPPDMTQGEPCNGIPANVQQAYYGLANCAANEGARRSLCLLLDIHMQMGLPLLDAYTQTLKDLIASSPKP